MFAPKENNLRNWVLVDAKDKVVGRLATEIATILRGKNKVAYTPNNDVGDFVVVINAKDVKFTANKEASKVHYSYSGWVGGLKETPVADLKETYPERILEHAVKGMIPKTPMGRNQMKKLKIYGGTEHPHGAQLPTANA